MAASSSLRPDGPALKTPYDFPNSPLSQSTRQPLMLGLFLDLQDRKLSTHPTSNSWTFPYNTRLVTLADSHGFDLAFSRTQWLPKGGYDGEASLDAFIALGAMAAVTKRIMLISTMHVLYGPLHPLHIAKWGATLDHIAQGRWGINVVTGHRAVEHQMFGWNRIEHDRRYEMAGELVEVVNSLWGETENLDYVAGVEGNGWKLENAWVTPKPVFGRPVWVNATGSPAGVEFAVRYSDLVFVTSPGGARIGDALESLPGHVKVIKNRAREVGRGEKIKVLINPVVVSRDTEEETDAYLRAVVEGQKGLGNDKTFSKAFNKAYDSDAHAWKARKEDPSKLGFSLGGNVEVIGTPEQVVEQFKGLHGTGIDGVMLGFLDWEKDFDHFVEKILPLLKEVGLRVD